MGTLEGGTALTFASGMAASQAVLELVEPGATVVAAAHLLPRGGGGGRRPGPPLRLDGPPGGRGRHRGGAGRGRRRRPGVAGVTHQPDDGGRRPAPDRPGAGRTGSARGRQHVCHSPAAAAARPRSESGRALDDQDAVRALRRAARGGGGAVGRPGDAGGAGRGTELLRGHPGTDGGLPVPPRAADSSPTPGPGTAERPGPGRAAGAAPGRPAGPLPRAAGRPGVSSGRAGR